MNQLLSAPEISTRTQNRPTDRVTQIIKAWLPNRGTVLFTLLLFGGFLWVQSAKAVPFVAPLAAGTSTNTIAYQGQLTDVNGALLTGAYDMTFRLYADAIGGAPLWTEQWQGADGVQVANGLFNVMLGSITPLDQTVITGNTNLFLSIAIGAEGEMTPRVQLGSVPFATQALTVPDASITSDKIADDAVTQVTQIFADDYVEMTSEGPLKDMSVTMTTTGKPVLILFSMRWGHSTAGQRFCYSIDRGSTQIVLSCDSDAGDIWGANTTLAITWLDTPPAGTHTYKVSIFPQGGTLYFKNRQMQLVELKK